ncbi:MAG: isoprenylcysteine carboxylmethyltransferase family protein [Bacteroidales bacterium]
MALLEEFEKQGNYLFRYRGILPLIILMAGLGAYIQTELNSTGFQDPVLKEIFRFFCLFVCFIGFGIRVYTVGHTPKNTSGRNTESQLADELNTTGIYSIVRHPLYLGNFFMWLGVALLTENVWFTGLFVFLYWVYYERIMFAEEQFLRKKFGTIYLDWAKATPAFIVSFKNWTPPKMSFSWKKVLKKEKNGFLAIFLVFFLFQCTRNIINDINIISPNWLFYATIVSGVSYVILKIIKNATNLLDEEDR